MPNMFTSQLTHLFLSIAKHCEYQRSRKLPSHHKCTQSLAAIITISELRDTI